MTGQLSRGECYFSKKRVLESLYADFRQNIQKISRS
jgi:hypothetical protein